MHRTWRGAPGVGGVIGRQRLLFDFWGDTVNLASRMESTGLPGHIQIAASTFQQLPVGRYDLSAHEVDVQGFGRLTTYLLRNALPGRPFLETATDKGDQTRSLTVVHHRTPEDDA